MKILKLNGIHGNFVINICMVIYQKSHNLDFFFYQWNMIIFTVLFRKLTRNRENNDEWKS